MTNTEDLHTIKTYMEKAMNEKSSLFGTVREKLSPAESGFQGRICEVHSGADSVKGIIAGFVWRTLHAVE